MNRSDSELWQQILDNDNKAWGELVNKYQALIYTIMLRMGLSMAEASDCFQQVWFLLLKNKNKIENPDRLKAWIVTTAKREALRVKKKAVGDVDESVLDVQADERMIADEQLEELQTQSILENGLKAIDERCRKLLKALFYFPEDYSYKRISKELNISINSLGAIRQRCLAKLKELIGKEI
ncbi:MAG: sigma-70 family RNA polymerase sigma factor [Calditrichaeota bacterium]|nr:MAG: sigma-70 family RNA polymerase sigma factor [Calditrichota bacterium]